ncbi:Crp/Fnr family transcriptional regulator [Dysosmobacter sp.]|uniref:Crp/Fnr family transcriptional regulator n=1 Tax=Dysosmobacter sp. TaxID=2591382 RepID=UPI002A8EF42A|nr:Crp/Fnr family transcriptional regulator [Dysosmobacter sp.]MDY3282187.1 Crp/Fnr family transcriptional regulator [Dysosmobacter sp.]
MARPEFSNQHIKEIFLRRGRKQEYAAGQLLVEKGTPVTKVGFLAGGHARTFVTNQDGDDVTLFYIGPDNLICSEGLTSYATVMVSVESITPVTLYAMAPEEFLRAWQGEGLPIQGIIDQLVSRIMLLSDYICCAHFRENDKKIAYFLYSEYSRSGDSIPYTHQQIAAVTGINRVSVSRILSQLARDGSIALEYRRIRVLDPQGLLRCFNTLGYFLD